jgi:hypothetical protein
MVGASLMKHFVDENNNVYGYPKDGSQDHLIGNKKEITIQERDALILQKQQANFDSEDWYRKRIYSYPELGEFVDAFIKGDANAMEEYKRKCLEIKAKYPKPEGF